MRHIYVRSKADEEPASSSARYGTKNRNNEALLLQRDRATRYVRKFVLCFTRYGSYKGFIHQTWPSRLFKGIITWHITHPFLG